MIRVKIFVFFLSYAFSQHHLIAQDKGKIKSGKMTYWQVLNMNGTARKSHRVLYFNAECSREKTLMAYPLTRGDTLLEPGSTQITTRTNEYEQKEMEIRHYFKGTTQPTTPPEASGVYQDLKNKLTYLLVGIPSVDGKREKYILKDEKLDFGWQITSESKKIGEFECTKAISKPFRGRVYEVWFAPEIPVSSGPWKLCGLPGLILEAKDQSGEVQFVFESLKENEDASLAKNQYENVNLPVISWEEYKKRMSKEAKKFSNYAQLLAKSTLKEKNIIKGDEKLDISNSNQKSIVKGIEIIE